MDRCPADGQLAFRIARQNTAGQQATVGRLSRVVAPGYPSTTAHLFGQFAHRMEEVHVVAGQLVDPLEVLSIVAYRQPITRSGVELIRGSASDSAVESPLQRGLVEHNQHHLLVTTRGFLDYL